MLLAQRGGPPFAGRYSLPGGNVEPGETALAAAKRELLEETGVEAEVAGALGEVDVPSTGGYRVTVFYGTWRTGIPRPGGDCVSTRWVALGALEELPLTEGTASLIRRAAALLGIDNG